MPVGLPVLTFGVLVIIGLSCMFIYAALQGRRARRAEQVDQSTDGTAQHTNSTTASGGATLRSIAVGIGCALLLVLVLMIGVFAFVVWAFRDFKLF